MLPLCGVGKIYTRKALIDSRNRIFDRADQWFHRIPLQIVRMVEFKHHAQKGPTFDSFVRFDLDVPNTRSQG